MTTLISFIGRGKLSDNGNGDAYKTVDYHFKNGKTVTSSFFMSAAIKSECYPFDNIIIIGSKTSSWASVIPFDDWVNNEALYDRLLVETAFEKNAKGIKLETIKLLESFLTSFIHKKVMILAHDIDLTEENSSQLVDEYVELILKSDDHVIVDITHGFRWMPQILIASLNYRNSFKNNVHNVKMIYGEESGEARELNALWDLHEKSRAIELFFSKFEPKSLAESFKDICPQIQDAIIDFGKCIQGNFFIPLVYNRNNESIGEPLRRIKNAIIEFKKIKNAPFWTQKAITELESIQQNLSKGPVCKRLFTLSKLLAQRALLGQAIMCLQLSFETFVVDYYNGGSDYGNYEETKVLIDQFLGEKQSLKNECQKINRLRNMVAHGAAESTEKNDKNLQKVAYLSSEYNEYAKIMKEKIFPLLSRH